MIRCQNSIVTVNVQSVRHQFQATMPASSRLIWEIFYNLVVRSLWQVAPDNLKCFFEFSACFQLCFKLAVSLQHCIPYVIVHWVYILRPFSYGSKREYCLHCVAICELANCGQPASSSQQHWQPIIRIDNALSSRTITDLLRKLVRNRYRYI